jgi:parallel beta-helix repeat protein
MNCSTGITISRSSNNTIEKNLIQKSGGSNGFSGSGICLSVSDHNIITGNNISSNFFYGIMLHNCDHNNIVNDTLVNNDYGIALFDSGHNNIINNAISNNDYGIELYSDHNSTINNTISNNDYGIEQGSHHNNIINNNISKNRVVGIYIRSSTINTALKNNFLNNQQDAFFYKSKKNTWKHNYWNRPRILPKLIFGTIEKNSKEILWFNIDWCPALRPYDIGG